MSGRLGEPLARKSKTKPSGEKRELWADRHLHDTIRRPNGQFLSTKRYYKPIEFTKPTDSNYAYMVKVWIKGYSKPQIIKMRHTATSKRYLDAPVGSRNRKAIYARVREIVEKSNKKVRRLRLISTINMIDGKKVEH